MSERPTIDLSDMTCGLIPQMRSALRESTGAVDILVRPEVRLAVHQAFGAGGAWDLEFFDEPGQLRCIFRPAQGQDDPLNIV
ncbi:hypothetical protein [Desulfohalovibrio reitneri]|uniref:hypothetical protein n=1 Tax=Desulfohalovibrio reitneri TaxID=1307759 RepID=UPI0004A7193A|nr:hypothetical protein [Desulfohalovibrio reitneri]